MLVKKELEFAGKKLVLETGELANQANMSVKVSYGDTVVLVTAVMGAANPDIDYFPLSTAYEEKLYASGTIKSSRFVKRDGKPTDHAVIVRRLVDHAIRPLFPKDFINEVQIIMTVLSLDEAADPEFAAMIGTSATLLASDIPWYGPVTSAKVGYLNNDYVLNPSREVIHTESDLDMFVSFVGADQKFLAIESESNNLPEAQILGAIEFAREGVNPLLTLITDFAAEVNPKGEKFVYESQMLDAQLTADVDEFAKKRVSEIIQKSTTKNSRNELLAQLKEELFAEFDGKYKKAHMETALYNVQKKALQHMIMVEETRPDGRARDEVRSVSAKVGVLPRTHGSGLFNRGDTQALTVATLGSPSLELLIQDMHGEYAKRYMHYYNFPPFSTGETARVMGPKPREIGHGMLAEKALKPMIPSQSDFPYTILLMSEILSSDGSSSMAATCGSTLALMDAGVPIKEMVAGVAMGLMVNEDETEHVLLTDIAGMEDGAGYMDFKIAGTQTGVTATQVDLKVKGIPMSLLPKIFEASKAARLQILTEMKKAIDTPRTELSKYAPKTETLKIDVDKIGVVIGPGGKTIKKIQTDTDTELSIEEDGTVFISGSDMAQIAKAVDYVTGLTKEVKVGEIYDGEVVEILDFGAIVQILPGKSGLLHVSEIVHEYVKTVTDYVNIGDKVRVKVIETGHNGKISLSMKALVENPNGDRKAHRDYDKKDQHSRPDRRRR